MAKIKLSVSILLLLFSIRTESANLYSTVRKIYFKTTFPLIYVSEYFVFNENLLTTSKFKILK